MPNGIEVRTGPVAMMNIPRNGRRSSRRKQNVNPIPSPRDLLYVLFRHWVKAAVVAITIFCLAFLAALLLPSKYTSEAQLLVRLGRESMPTATVAGGPQAVPLLDQSTQVNSEAQIFRSREIVAATVRKLGVETFLDEAPAASSEKLAGQEALAARILANNINIRTEPLSAVIKVSFDAKSPTEAHDIVQAYVDCYLDHRARLYGSGAGDLFEGLTAESKNVLAKIEDQIRALKDQTGVSDVAMQKNILLNRIATLQQTIDSVSVQLSATTERIASRESQLATTPKQIALSRSKNEPMGVISTAEIELNKLKSDLDRALVIYQPESPTILQLKEQIASLEIRLGQLQTSSVPEVEGLNPTWAELDKLLATDRADKKGLEAQLKTLTDQIDKAREGQAILNEVDLKMGQLAREQGMVLEQLQKVVEGRNFSSIDQAMGRDKIGNVSPSQNATVPTKPSSPNRKLIVLFGMFTAVIGGLGTAFVSQLLDQNISRPQELKRLGFSRIVSVPLLNMGSANESASTLSAETQAIVDLTEHEPTPMRSERIRPTRYVRSTARAGANLLPAARTIDPNLSPREALERWKDEHTLGKPVATEVKAPPAPTTAGTPRLSPRLLEVCHSALERLVFSPVATGEFAMPRSIAVIGVTPHQGATTIAAHFAAAMAEYLPGETGGASDRLLVVDANIAAPGMHGVFDAQNEPGISDWIKQPAVETQLGDYVRATSIRNVDLLSAGARSVGHQPGRWTEAAAVALQLPYKAVVMDLPSIARSEASARVAAMCDAALLVVECNDANREVVRQAALRLAESGVRLLGVVLNKRTYPIPEKLYRWI